MTLDEFLKEARLFADVSISCHGKGHDCEPAPSLMHAHNVLRLLAIIEAQRAELEKAERWKCRCSDDFHGCTCGHRFFGGNAAIAKRFEGNEL